MRPIHKTTFGCLPIIALLLAGPAYAQTTSEDMQLDQAVQEATPEGTTFQANMPPMSVMRAMFLDLPGSANAGIPVPRKGNMFEVGERIAIYAKFAHVGRVYPGALDGLMSLQTDVRVTDATGTVIINQMSQSAALESVPYPYDGPIPDAYFETFKLNILAMPMQGTFTISLTFYDRTRPETETQPVEIVFEAVVE